jgi:hypothetical protein
MMKRNFMTVAMLWAVAALAAPATAQQRDRDYDADVRDRWYDPRTWFDRDEADDVDVDVDYDDRAQDRGDRDSDREVFGDRQVIRGEVVGLERLSSGYGDPESIQIRIRAEGGQEKTVHLGDLSYFGDDLPRLRQGQSIKLHGDYVSLKGARYFKAREIRAASDSFMTPRFLQDRYVLRGTLQDVRGVKMRGDDLDAAVVQVRTDQGRTQAVLIGNEEDLDRRGAWITKGSPVRVEGYARQADDGRQRFFVAQAVRVEADSTTYGAERRSRDDDRRSEQRYGTERRSDRDTGNREEASGQRVRISGTVASAREIWTDRADEQSDHSLLQLNFEDGRGSTVLDLGDSSAAELDIQSGDDVVIEGRRAQAHGRSVIIAEHVQINGQWRTLSGRAEHQTYDRRD